MAEIKKIEEGMTGAKVAQLLYDNDSTNNSEIVQTKTNLETTQKSVDQLQQMQKEYPVKLVIENFSHESERDADKTLPIVSILGESNPGAADEYQILFFRHCRMSRHIVNPSGEGKHKRYSVSGWIHPSHGAEPKSNEIRFINKISSTFAIHSLTNSYLYFSANEGGLPATFMDIVGWMIERSDEVLPKKFRTVTVHCGIGYRKVKNNIEILDPSLYPDKTAKLYQLNIRNIGFAAFKNGVQVSDFVPFSAVVNLNYEQLTSVILSHNVYQTQ